MAEWETDGNKRQAVEIIADTIQFLGSSTSNGAKDEGFAAREPSEAS